ncbi:hypothetical protein [Nocardia nova]|uniref:hypothetical protein n=1 Tax=Nocardia nova TaxID=37330 RepID=UPI001895C0BF|nr:hypothetical protein [Nocardia nova]MBF6277063.1 hypothetical protein [Nocardia nova]
MNVITQIDGDFADIRPLNEADRGALATKLLDAAGDRRREVRTVTGRSAGEFRVPLDIAREAGLLEGSEDSEKESAKPARKTASRSKTTKAADEKADDGKAGDDKPAEDKTGDTK